MRKRFFAYFILCLWGFLLSVRLAQPTIIRPVVTQIEVSTYQQENHRHFRLSDEESMRSVLNYLRAAKTNHIADKIQVDPAEEITTIKVLLANGKCHIYQQIGTRYLRKDNTHWMIIDPDQGKKLEKVEKFLFENKL